MYVLANEPTVSRKPHFLEEDERRALASVFLTSRVEPCVTRVPKGCICSPYSHQKKLVCLAAPKHERGVRNCYLGLGSGEEMFRHNWYVFSVSLVFFGHDKRHRSPKGGYKQ
ncbi:hypothetical protein BaRGS_00011971 [Batillaria attramentaria]|uniref:Uncharacterized protein n=1 Tax=Batillaria attramentaria TaxID=370345 RepID=A0ABD0LBJ7_9CAEN